MITGLFFGVLLVGWATTAWWVMRLRELLRTDSLTGLANRTGLRKAFARAPRGGGVSLLMLDLNDFKSINDTYGHRIGDLVLVEVGRRLRRYQRRGHLAVRLSGDEFAFWLGAYPGDDNREYAEDLAERITSAIAEPMYIAGLRLTIGASVGIAISPVKPTALERLLSPADRSMYGNKSRDGRQPIARSSPESMWEVVV